jgi:hypothetical protein
MIGFLAGLAVMGVVLYHFLPTQPERDYRPPRVPSLRPQGAPPRTPRLPLAPYMDRARHPVRYWFNHSRLVVVLAWIGLILWLTVPVYLTRNY